MYQVISLDSSVFRRYTWTTSITGTLPQLFGGVILMDGWTHNVDIDASGNFLGCDDDGPCQCYAFDENGQQAVYTSATTTSGQVP